MLWLMPGKFPHTLSPTYAAPVTERPSKQPSCLWPLRNCLNICMGRTGKPALINKLILQLCCVYVQDNRCKSPTALILGMRQQPRAAEPQTCSMSDCANPGATWFFHSDKSTEASCQVLCLCALCSFDTQMYGNVQSLLQESDLGKAWDTLTNNDQSEIRGHSIKVFILLPPVCSGKKEGTRKFPQDVARPSKRSSGTTSKISVSGT